MFKLKFYPFAFIEQLCSLYFLLMSFIKTLRLPNFNRTFKAYLTKLTIQTEFFMTVFNRPGVAGAVLQTPS